MKGHTRRRGKTWAFVVDIGTDPATGKRRQKWVSGFERERDAAKAMRDYIARIERGEAVAESNDSVASYLRDQWLPLRRSKVKESTWAGYQDAVEGRIIPAIGALPLRKVTPKHIAKLYEDLLASGSRDPRRGPGLAPKTVRNTGLVIKKAFGDAVRLGLLARNPAQHVELPRVEQNEMKTWSTEQAREFITFIRGDRLEALWILMLTSGMRRGEVIGLKWADIDLDAGRLAVTAHDPEDVGAVAVTPANPAPVVMRFGLRGVHALIFVGRMKDVRADTAPALHLVAPCWQQADVQSLCCGFVDHPIHKLKVGLVGLHGIHIRQRKFALRIRNGQAGKLAECDGLNHREAL